MSEGRFRLEGVGVSLPVQDELAVADLVDLATSAEVNGYDVVVCGEIAGPEVFALLGAVAAKTSRIGLGTAVITVYTRSAALAAMGFSTLEYLAPGRVFAGVGSGSSIIVEAWHGRRFEAPLRTARAFIADVRTALAGERIGRADPALGAPPFRLMPSGRQSMPIVLAAMHPGMLRLAGEVADGVLLAFCPPAEVATRAGLVRQGAIDAGRDPDDVAIIASVNSYAGPDHDRAMLRLRRFVLQYSVLPTHRTSIEGSFPAIDKATEAWRNGDRARALEHVDDDTIRRMCAIGGSDGAAVVDRVDELRAAGVDLVLLHTLGAGPGDLAGVRRTIDATASLLHRDPPAKPRQRR